MLLNYLSNRMLTKETPPEKPRLQLNKNKSIEREKTNSDDRQFITELQKKNEGLQSKTKELTVLYEIARILGSQINADESLNQAFQIIKQIFPINYFLFFSFHNEIRELHLQFGQGVSSKALKNINSYHIPVEKTNKEFIKESGEKKMRDYFTSFLLSYFKENKLSDFYLESFQAIPIIIEDKLSGIFCFGSNIKNIFKKKGQFLSILALEIISLYEKTSCMVKSTQLITMGKMISEITHSFRNPITNIKSALQYLEDNWDNDHSRNKSLEILNNNVFRLISRMEELLNFSNPLETQNKIVDINSTLNQVLTFLKTELYQNNISLTCELAQDLNPAYINEKQIEEAFLNILTNAIESMPQGGKLKILTKNFNCPRDKKKNYVVIKFSDSGTGISPMVKKKMFEHFYTTKKSGTGLGLAAVNRIIQSHNGRIKVQGEVNKGTTFELYIPVK